jgi:predicted Zn-dependent protease
MRIGSQFWKAGRLGDAEQAIRAALSLQPNPNGYNTLSQILDSLSRKGEAISAMREACKLDPENKMLRTRLAKLTASSVTPSGVGTAPSHSSESSIRATLAAPPPGVLDRIRTFLRRIT